MPQQCLRVILYARVSNDPYIATKGVRRSVNQQLKKGRRFCSENGWEIVGEYSDNDQSASQYARGEREDWPKVEEYIREGAADVLWLWEISRGTRDRIVWAHLVDACQTNRMYIALDEDLWDTTNPDHMRYLDGLMADSIHESGKSRKRVLRDMADYAEEGKPHGPSHYAYDREYDPKTGELIRQVPNPVRADLCRDIADRLLVKNQTRSTIAVYLNTKRIPTPRGYVVGDVWYTKKGRRLVSRGWTEGTITKVMSSPSLMGKRGHHGRIITEGGWDAVLDEPTWRAVQKKLEVEKLTERRGETRPRDGAAEYQASGIMICDVCEAPTYVTTWRGTPRYRCVGVGKGTPMHGNRVVSIMDEAIETLLFERLAHPDVREALMPADDAGARNRAEEEVTSLEEELEELYADVEAGRVSRRMAQADEQRLVGALEKARAASVPRFMDPLTAELVSGDPKKVWSGWELSQRRAALRLLTKEIRMLPVGKTGRRKLLPEQHVRIVWAGAGT